MNCRFCKEELNDIFLDLVSSPVSNSYLTCKDLNESEEFFPLKLFICKSCKLVQIDEYVKSNTIFNNDYAYFSSYSISWLRHAEEYVQMITNKLSLNCGSQVLEVASNDGYLLQFFKNKKIPCMGVEPTKNTANVARKKGINVVEEFFGSQVSTKLQKSDLVLANNVLAHVPDVNDFVKGLKIALKPKGTITVEFPHILNLIKFGQFDTVYHEHFSYFSLYTVMLIFESQQLKIYDVDELPTHGGSLRIYATHQQSDVKASLAVSRLLDKEKEFGLLNLNTYTEFQKKADEIKNNFLSFLLQAKRANKKVIGYGAAAKGNTLLNYAGVKSDLIKFVVDKSPYKQGKYLPGSHIPILSENEIRKYKPHYIVVFPWNILDEIVCQLDYVKDWGGRFVIVIPEVKVI